MLCLLDCCDFVVMLWCVWCFVVCFCLLLQSSIGKGGALSNPQKLQVAYRLLHTLVHDLCVVLYVYVLYVLCCVCACVVDVPCVVCGATRLHASRRSCMQTE